MQSTAPEIEKVSIFSSKVKRFKSWRGQSAMFYKLLFWTVAVAVSLFYGMYAVVLFHVLNPGKWWPVGAWHNFTNFVGSMVGWTSVYYLIVWRLTPLHCYIFKTEDTIPFAVAILGVTGFLPYTLEG